MRKKRPGRFGSAAVAAFAGLALSFAAILNARDAVLYNASPSMPIGFYARMDAALSRGAIVTVRAADVAPTYARERGFADARDRFLKRIAAATGDRVCIQGDRLIINSAIAAHRLKRDSAGRRLPQWSGCRTLADDEILLLGYGADSFDGRYWGPISTTKIEGVWRPIAHAQR